ncbi:hypothetical protein cyc_07318 [Cyclospora cayetanensis]|uniref:SAM-dependent methyltransferase RsmB-F/NOP2-type catalytic core domain-containing protein n=1 Tax=Cyclospora cayetanensis TaxID=88456 RepID=A0A1D3CTP4_9EIME|nr:hypothetical protein cyc_07318 [Cyclospora cayetanensis]
MELCRRLLRKNGCTNGLLVLCDGRRFGSNSCCRCGKSEGELSVSETVAGASLGNGSLARKQGRLARKKERKRQEAQEIPLVVLLQEDSNTAIEGSCGNSSRNAREDAGLLPDVGASSSNILSGFPMDSSQSGEGRDDFSPNSRTDRNRACHGSCHGECNCTLPERLSEFDRVLLDVQCTHDASIRHLSRFMEVLSKAPPPREHLQQQQRQQEEFITQAHHHKQQQLLVQQAQRQCAQQPSFKQTHRGMSEEQQQPPQQPTEPQVLLRRDCEQPQAQEVQQPHQRETELSDSDLRPLKIPHLQDQEKQHGPLAAPARQREGSEGDLEEASPSREMLADYEGLVCLQQELLNRAYELLAPGGLLVYSSCSSDCRQNEEAVLQLLRLRRGALFPLPCRGLAFADTSIDQGACSLSKEDPKGLESASPERHPPKEEVSSIDKTKADAPREDLHKGSLHERGPPQPRHTAALLGDQWHFSVLHNEARNEPLILVVRSAFTQGGTSQGAAATQNA